MHHVHVGVAGMAQVWASVTVHLRLGPRTKEPRGQANATEAKWLSTEVQKQHANVQRSVHYKCASSPAVTHDAGELGLS